MVTYLEELPLTEAENVKRTIRDLFRQTCILQVKYDPVTLTPRDNPRYQTCMKHKAFVEDYLSVLGCELKHDPQEHIFRLEGEGVITERMSMTTTLIVLIMKLIYREKILGEGLHATVTKLSEIREYGKNTNLITRKLTSAEWKEALYLMRMHQMIDVPGAVRDVEDQTPIYIYSTINLYCASMDINEIVERYREEVEKLMDAGEEEEREAGEEDIYPDADQ
ncbi:MAG: DUF4194 domain-containing protein [Clostridiales bacterium]|nr:DUF4194 domain-containing protein [Clostridiales bacterium]